MSFLSNPWVRGATALAGLASGSGLFDDSTLLSDIGGVQGLNLNLSDVIGGANIATGVADIADHGANFGNIAQLGLGGFNMLQSGGIGDFGNFGTFQNVWDNGFFQNGKAPSVPQMNSLAPKSMVQAPNISSQTPQMSALTKSAVRSGIDYTPPTGAAPGTPGWDNFTGNGFSSTSDVASAAAPAASGTEGFNFGSIASKMSIPGVQNAPASAPAVASSATNTGTLPSQGIGQKIISAIVKNPIGSMAQAAQAGALFAGIFANDPGKAAAEQYASERAQLLKQADPNSDAASSWKQNYLAVRTQQVDQQYAQTKAEMEAEFARRGMTDSTVAQQAMASLNAEYAKLKTQIPFDADQAWAEYVSNLQKNYAVASQTAAQGAAMTAAAAKASVPDFGSISQSLGYSTN